MVVSYYELCVPIKRFYVQFVAIKGNFVMFIQCTCTIKRFYVQFVAIKGNFVMFIQCTCHGGQSSHQTISMSSPTHSYE